MIAQRYNQVQELLSINSPGMSRLYTAFDNKGKQWVVLKLLKGDPKNPQQDQKQRQMFEREIDIAQHLEHDYILRAIDKGTTTLTDMRASLLITPTMPLPDFDYHSRLQDRNNLPFIVYPYISDGSLSDLVYSDPPWQKWSLLQTGELILQAASALHFMHTRNQPLVHWDVKPANFLIQREDRPTRIAHLFLCDFGISRAQKGKADETSNIYGTPNYMAPEQFDGKVRCESDQYTLAMMACYLLTSEYPLYHEASLTMTEWAYIHRNIVPRAPSSINPQRVQSIHIDEIILKALRKDPEERFATIWLFAKTLYDAVERQNSASHAATLEIQMPTLAPGPRLAPMPLHPPIDTSEYQLKADGRPIVQQPPAIHKNVWSALPYTSFKKLRVYTLPTMPYMVQWSRQGDKLVCLFLEHTPCILSQDGTQQLVPMVKSGQVACWAPQGNILAISSQHQSGGIEESTISIVDTRVSTSSLPTISLSQSVIHGLDWSVNGQLALWAEGKKYIQLYSLPQKSLTASHVPSSRNLSTEDTTCNSIGVLRWSPDGSFLAAGGVNGTILCWQKETYEIYWQNSDTPYQVYSLTWSPDGKFLAIAFKDRRVILVDIYHKCIKTEWKNLPLIPLALSFSSDNILSISSTKKYLLLGSIHDTAPTIKQHGQLLAAWCPTRSELATLDPEQDTKLVIWQN